MIFYYIKKPSQVLLLPHSLPHRPCDENKISSIEYIPKASVREIILETWTLVLKQRGLGRHGHSFLQASLWSMMVRTLKVMDELKRPMKLEQACSGLQTAPSQTVI